MPASVAPGDLPRAKEAFAISHAQSAISNHLAGPLPVIQNSAVVEKYLRLIGNKIETWTSIAGSQPSGGTQASRLVGKRLLASTHLTVPATSRGNEFPRKFVAAGHRNQHARRARSQAQTGRGGGVGRVLGVGSDLGVGVARGVPVGVGVGVDVGIGVAVAVGVGVAVAVTVAVGVGVGV